MEHSLLMTFLTVYAAFGFIAIWRQRRLVRSQDRPASKSFLTPEEHTSVVSYCSLKYAFLMFMQVYETVKEIILLAYYPFIYEKYIKGWPSDQVVCIVIYNVINTIIDIPVNAFKDFVVEHTHGFNAKTPEIFFYDVGLSLTYGTIAVYAFGYISVFFVERHLEQHWLVWWILMCIIVTAIHPVYHYIIAPLYNSFQVIDRDSGIRERVERLTEEAGFKCSQIYLMDGSTRSAHSNAYFAGIGKSKHIVIFDTLAFQLNADQIVAVFAHELGHCVKNHVYYNLAISYGLLLLASYSFKAVSDAIPYQCAGLKIIYFLASSNCIALPFTLLYNIFSRSMEHEADVYAVSRGCGQDLRSALIKMSIENKAAPVNDPLFAALYHTHPTTAERIALIDEEMAKNK